MSQIKWIYALTRQENGKRMKQTCIGVRCYCCSSLGDAEFLIFSLIRSLSSDHPGAGPASPWRSSSVLPERSKVSSFLLDESNWNL